MQLINSKIFYYPQDKSLQDKFKIQNRRFLGNKYKLLDFIEDIVNENCGNFKVFCDIFAGTGVVGDRFNKKKVKIISNDLLYSNFIPLTTFLGINKVNSKSIKDKINYLNSLNSKKENYFSLNFGNRYFTLENAKKIGEIRKNIDEISTNKNEKYILLSSLIYATDRIANTVGHYDAYRLKMDTTQQINLLIPEINFENNINNEIYQEDANELIKKISCDVLYIDPPYNSRQYSDTYHLLENLARWELPELFGKAKKMDRKHIKSKYSSRNANVAFKDLIDNVKAKHILVSYNNTGESKHSRSNSLIKDGEIISILKTKGKVKIYERDYQAFTTGRSDGSGHTERVFYCRVYK